MRNRTAGMRVHSKFSSNAPVLAGADFQHQHDSYPNLQNFQPTHVLIAHLTACAVYGFRDDMLVRMCLPAVLSLLSAKRRHMPLALNTTRICHWLPQSRHCLAIRPDSDLPATNPLMSLQLDTCPGLRLSNEYVVVKYSRPSSQRNLFLEGRCDTDEQPCVTLHRMGYWWLIGSNGTGSV